MKKWVWFIMLGLMLTCSTAIAGDWTDGEVITEDELNNPVLDSLKLEGGTVDDYETELAVTDPTADRTITFPNASGTVAVSAAAPITLSAAGGIGLTLAKDIVAGTGLSGGEDNVLPGADADTTISLDLTAANTWTGAHSFQAAAPQITLGKDETTPTDNIVGTMILTSAGDNEYYSSISAGTNTSASLDFTLPITLPEATAIVTCSTAGQLAYDTTSYANNVLGNLGSVACNTSITSDTANTDDLGTEAIYWKQLYLASSISFEGATDDGYQTTLTATDTTASDKTITLPNASGTVAVSATAPATVSALGDIGVTVLKDLVTTSPLTGGTNDILPGSDSDVTLSITMEKDLVAGVGLSGGADDVLPGADADVTITFAPAELESVTFGGGAQASIAHTFDVSGTDTVVTYGSASMDIGAAVFATTANIKSTPRKWLISVVQPNAMYTAGSTIIPIGTAPAALTVTNVKCNTSSASYEVAGDLKYADARIGLANAAVVNDFDTTSGTRDDSTITSAAVASGKFVYLLMDSAPNASMTDFTVEVTWDFD